MKAVRAFSPKAKGFRPAVGGFKRGATGFKPGEKHAPVSEVKESLLDKLRKTERALASIKDSDANAKWTLARMRSKQMFIDTNDTDYWICICFESRQQKDEFLRLSRLELPDEDKYFSGLALAKAMGLKLTRDRRAFHTLGVNQRWEPYAMPETNAGGAKAKGATARRGRSSRS